MALRQDNRRWWHKVVGFLSTIAFGHAMLLAALKLTGINLIIGGVLVTTWWVIFFWPIAWILFYCIVDYNAFTKNLEENQRHEANSRKLD